MIAPTGWATARAPLEVPEALNAPLFSLLMDDLAEGERRVILDLGAPSTAMLALLARSPCRVEIADFVREGGIARLNAVQEAVALPGVAESLLPGHRFDTPVDAIFCWDLLNYLQPAAIAALLVAIARRSRPGATAHALIAYSERTMPAAPACFVPRTDGRLENHVASTDQVASPRYSPEDLGRLLGAFVIERGRLLANGMQEYLFRLG